jgi:hypothetical protein
MNKSRYPLIAVEGVVVRGHRVASGLGEDSPYPEGSIRMQKPFFRALGLDLDDCHEATLNLSISPWSFTVHDPAFTFRQVEWTTLHPPEHFSFSRCYLEYRGMEYAGWIYYPHPETKRTHFQSPSLLEVIAPLIPDVQYGDKVLLWLNPQEITIVR